MLSNKQTKQNFKPRRNFDEKPRFGTIEDRIFSKGEEGLLSKPGDDDDKASKLADWEVALGGMAKRAIRGQFIIFIAYMNKAQVVVYYVLQ